ncbi:transcription initiation factor TFIID subunit 3 [Elysia marginata]|uniref:Transcription initiation factor TFIID subunit 3 n=1 Tax=Elysia marginata TaxID=1093978 RepID=A0AAV4J2J6_9GAST|nr:transcription initiation factor TFIID subunit 3 [Elysia marginata]
MATYDSFGLVARGLKKKLMSEETCDSPESVSFHEIIATPVKAAKKTQQRKKAINYRAAVVSKSLFASTDYTITPAQKGKGSIKSKGKQKKTSSQPPKAKGNSTEDAWSCPVCRENVQSAMRRCDNCADWYHEDCVGLTEDDDFFVCPECDN